MIWRLTSDDIFHLHFSGILQQTYLMSSVTLKCYFEILMYNSNY